MNIIAIIAWYNTICVFLAYFSLFYNSCNQLLKRSRQCYANLILTFRKKISSSAFGQNQNETSMMTTTTFNDLCDDLLLHISSFLYHNDLPSFELINKRCSKLCENHQVYKRITTLNVSAAEHQEKLKISLGLKYNQHYFDMFLRNVRKKRVKELVMLATKCPNLITYDTSASYGVFLYGAGIKLARKCIKIRQFEGEGLSPFTVLFDYVLHLNISNDNIEIVKIFLFSSHDMELYEHYNSDTEFVPKFITLITITGQKRKLCISVSNGLMLEGLSKYALDWNSRIQCSRINYNDYRQTTKNDIVCYFHQKEGITCEQCKSQIVCYNVKTDNWVDSKIIVTVPEPIISD